MKVLRDGLEGKRRVMEGREYKRERKRMRGRESIEGRWTTIEIDG